MSTEIQKQNTQSLAHNVAPRSFDELWKFADMASQTELVPKQYQGKPAAIFIASQWGLNLGMHPIVAVQNICVINGRPSIYGDMMIALVRASGKLEYMVESWDGTSQAAICKIKRVGEPEVVEAFSLEDAKKAGLLGKSGPWSTYPKRMAKFRARGFALRDTFADVLGGLISAEEAADMPREVAVEVVDTRTNVPAQVPMSKVESKEVREEENSFATNEEKDKFYVWCKQKGFSHLVTLEEQTAINRGVSREWIEFLSKDLKTRKLTKATPAAEAEPAPEQPTPAQAGNSMADDVL